MSAQSHRVTILRVVIFSGLLALVLFGWWAAQASFWVQPTVYAPLAVKNLSPKRGLAGPTYVSDFDYVGASWFYGWGPQWPWPYEWDAPGASPTPGPTPTWWQHGAYPLDNGYQQVPMLWCWWQLIASPTPTATSSVPTATSTAGPSPTSTRTPYYHTPSPIPTQYHNGPILLWNEPNNSYSSQCGKHYLGGPGTWEGYGMWPTPRPTPHSVYIRGQVRSYDPTTCILTTGNNDPRLHPNENVNWALYSGGGPYYVASNTETTITLQADCPQSVSSAWLLVSWQGKIGSGAGLTLTVSPTTNWQAADFPQQSQCPYPGICNGWLDLSVRVYRPSLGKYVFGDITAWSPNSITVAQWLSPVPGGPLPFTPAAGDEYLIINPPMPFDRATWHFNQVRAIAPNAYIVACADDQEGLTIDPPTEATPFHPDHWQWCKRWMEYYRGQYGAYPNIQAYAVHCYEWFLPQGYCWQGSNSYLERYRSLMS